MNSIIISLLILSSCNYSSETDKASDKIATNNPEEAKIEQDHKKDLNYIEQGKKYAMQTQKVLAKNLIKEIKTKGTIEALTFCSAKAYPLTDSMALALNVKLKRVSDKARNHNNFANKQEMAYIQKAKEMLAKGETLKPKMTDTNGKMLGYYPILTNQVCLQCHGTIDTEILPETKKQIHKLYPKDKAIAYGVNELRGIWVVEMDKK